jgi:S-methylmethionine-dependent homocysteine/selenocysteine methylase
MSRLAHQAAQQGAAAVLVNCTPATDIAPFVAAIAGCGVPVGAYANAGPVGGGLGWGAPQPERYASLARQWVELGAEIVGGCCGTDARHIESLRSLAIDPKRNWVR